MNLKKDLTICSILATKTKSEGSHTPSDRDNQSVSSLSISVSENPTPTHETPPIDNQETPRPISTSSNVDTDSVTLFDRVAPQLLIGYEDIRMKKMAQEGRFRSQTAPVSKLSGPSESPSEKKREGEIIRR